MMILVFPWPSRAAAAADLLMINGKPSTAYGIRMRHGIGILESTVQKASGVIQAGHFRDIRQRSGGFKRKKPHFPAMFDFRRLPSKKKLRVCYGKSPLVQWLVINEL